LQQLSVGCALAALAASPAGWSASGSSTPSQTQPSALRLPDLAPTRLFFDRSCDLKGEIANKGAQAFHGSADGVVKRNGQTISTHTHSLSLAPGAKTVVRLAPRSVLGTWVEENSSWLWAVDTKHKVKESNESNNSVTYSGKCVKRPQ